MKITFLFGSPRKIENSYTYPFIEYIIKNFPEINFNIARIAKNKIEDEDFNNILDQVNESDGIIWVYPVYIGFIPSQMKRFIEKIFEKKKEHVFHDKYALNISSSANFSEHTAINYIQAICGDLKMRYIDDYIINTKYLPNKKSVLNLLKFIEYFINSINSKTSTTDLYPSLNHKMIKYTASINTIKRKTSNHFKCILITDADNKDENLMEMIKALINISEYTIDVVNLNLINIKGGCLGCLQCCIDGECIYADQYIDLYNDKIKNADAIIFAATIKDRGLSSKIKEFIDREFVFNHIPIHKGKQLAFLLSGNYKETINIKEFINVYCNVRGFSLVDIVSDNEKDIELINQNIINLSDKLQYYLENNYIKPKSFYSTYLEVLNNFIYSSKYFFYQDYLYCKKNNLFNLPNIFTINIKNFFLFFYFIFYKDKKKFHKRLLKHYYKGMIKKYLQK